METFHDQSHKRNVYHARKSNPRNLRPVIEEQYEQKLENNVYSY